MSLVLAYKSRGLSRDIIIYDKDGNVITPSGSDLVRVSIGREGKTPALTVISNAVTPNGSKIVMGATSVLRLDASDLAFSPGTYTMAVEYFDAVDGSEWKMVSADVFCLEETSGIVDISEVMVPLGLSGSITDEERTFLASAIADAEAAVVRYLRYNPVLASRTEFHPQQPFQAQISRGIWEVMEQRAVLRQVSEAATNELQLQCLPIRGDPLVVVRVDYDGRSETRPGSFPNETEKRMGYDFWPNYDVVGSDGVKVCRDGVLRTIGLWPTTPGTVKITYTAGYTADEFRGNDPILNARPIWSAVVAEACRRVQQIVAMKKGRLGIMPGVVTNESFGDYSYTMDISHLVGGDLTAASREALGEYVNWGFSLGS